MAKYTGHTITSDSALGSAVIQRSIRFFSDDGQLFQRTPSSAGNRKKWTFSAWIKRTKLGAEQRIFGGNANASHIFFASNDELTWDLANDGSGSSQANLNTEAKFRDTTSWLHLVCALDTDNGTANNRMRMYINGTELTDFGTRTNPSSGYSTNAINDTSLHTIGRRTSDQGSDGMRFDGYMAEINFIDGQQYDPSYFGFTDPQTGIWLPKRYEGTYGTNGFYLDLSDNSSTAALGIDKSPNGNDFTTNNFAVSDSVKDTPTNAFATLNANIASPDVTFKEGSLYFDTPDTHKSSYANIAVNSGKWYWEAKAIAGSTIKWTYGVSDVNNTSGKQVSGQNYLLAHTTQDSAGTYALGDAVSIYYGDLRKNGSVTGSSVQTNLAQGDIIGIALDVDAGKVWFARNGTWINGSATASTTLNPASHDTTVTTGETYVPAFSGESADWQANFGQDDSFSGTSTSQGNEDENGLGSFYYAVPSGFRALCTKNLPPNVPSVVRPEKHFKCVAYSGTGSTQKIESLEFAPDLVWVKRRNASNYHILTDTVRGAADYLVPNNSDAESVGGGTQLVNAFFKNGFQVGTENAVNNSSGTYVAWCWKAGGATVSNSDGSITSSVSANQEGGFSIVTYAGNGTTGATVGHGLGKVPAWVIIKCRSHTDDWMVYHQGVDSSAPEDYYLKLNSNGAAVNSVIMMNDTAPTTSVFSLQNDSASNSSGRTYVAYCWSEIPGFSKFGSYTGNGNNDGPFIHTGFRPAWVTVKCSSNTNNWQTWDNARETSNVMQRALEFNDDSTTDGASSNTAVDFLSNGFKIRTSFTRSNSGGYTYAYMAFAEQPDMTPFDVFPNAR